jgi:putative ABC transport system substrate-binding protein
VCYPFCHKHGSYRAVKRREFITLVGGAAAWPLAARAQQGKPAIIGLLGSGTAAAQSEWTAAFVQRLRQLGWSEGRNLRIEYRWAEGRSERFAEIAAEFVRLKVDVIVTHNTPPPLAAKQATSVIPIVFATAGDPVGTGVVESLARPGGNVTGLSSQHPDVSGKRLELLRELVPGLRRLAFLAEPGSPFSALELCEVRTAARTLGLEVMPVEIRRGGDIPPAFEALKSRAEAIYVVPNPVLFVNRIRINTLAVGARLPTMHGVREYVEAGSLMSYGPNWPHMWSRAAHYVHRILQGTKPADLPVEQPVKFELAVNLKTAKALGLEVPAMLLARADEVIE